MAARRENLPETIKPGGKPDCLANCRAAFRPPAGTRWYVRGSRMRGAKFCDRCGASIRFPEDQPAALTVPAESRLIQEIKERFGI